MEIGGGGLNGEAIAVAENEGIEICEPSPQQLPLPQNGAS